MSFCLPNDWLEVAKILLSIATLLIAWRGLNTWNEQLKGTHRFEVRKNIIVLLSRLEDKLILLQDISQNLSIDDRSLENKQILRESIIIPSLNSIQEDIKSLNKIIAEDKYWISEYITELTDTFSVIMKYIFTIKVIHSDSNLEAKQNEIEELIRDRAITYISIIKKMSQLSKTIRL